VVELDWAELGEGEDLGYRGVAGTMEQLMAWLRVLQMVKTATWRQHCKKTLHTDREEARIC
jgi:hypothetical protein